MGIFKKINFGLRKTRNNVSGAIDNVLDSYTSIDEELFDELEEALVMGDVGVTTASEITLRLNDVVRKKGIKNPADVKAEIKEIVAEMLEGGEDMGLITIPSVILVIGVNGVGKTTSIGKISAQLKAEGKNVVLGAADTFRAAAIDQLQVWTDRAGVEIVKHAEGSDPGAVVYDAISAAKARNCDVLIIDTAGRLHNKKNLMEELAKINRIMSTQAEGCSKEVLLVLDATTGPNAVNQARLFSQTAELTGIVLTKLDGTAKGGIVISIMNELNIPVKLVGVGEQIDDLQPFDSKSFVAALFEDNDTDNGEAESEEESAEEIADDEIESVSDVSESETELSNYIEETESAEEIEEISEEDETVSDDEISGTENAETDDNTSEEIEKAEEEVSENDDNNEEAEKPKKKGFFSKLFRGDK